MIENSSIRDDFFHIGGSNYIAQDEGRNECAEPEHKSLSKLNASSPAPETTPLLIHFHSFREFQWGLLVTHWQPKFDTCSKEENQKRFD